MKQILLFLILILIYKESYSQELTLNDAIRTAINNDPKISATQNNIQIQNFNIRSTKGSLFPSLTLSGGWNKNNTVSKGTTSFQNGIPIAIGNVNKTTDNYNLSLNSQVTLFNGFVNYEEVTLEEETLQSLRIQLEQQRDDVIRNVNQAFFDILKKSQIVIINRQNLETSQAQKRLIEEYQKVGKKTIADIYKQDVQVAQDELQLEQSINDLQKAKVDLLIAMNENPERSFEISGNYADSNLKSNDLRAILSKLGSTQTLVSRALTNRDDLKNLEQNIEINRMKLDIAGKTLYFPTVNAFSNYNMSGNAIGELTNTRVFQIGINFSYPIFQGFRLDVQRQIAEVNVRQREEDLTNARKIVGGNIKKTQLDMESIIKQVEILDRNIASARLDVELTTENYRVGYGTLLDVQTATTKLNNLLIQRSNAIYNFLQLRKLLEYYTGDLKL